MRRFAAVYAELPIIPAHLDEWLFDNCAAEEFAKFGKLFGFIPKPTCQIKIGRPVIFL